MHRPTCHASLVASVSIICGETRSFPLPYRQIPVPEEIMYGLTNGDDLGRAAKNSPSGPMSTENICTEILTKYLASARCARENRIRQARPQKTIVIQYSMLKVYTHE
ncbi:hypothetical protein PISMIDRAFT_271967 [Pisolithus microcarpus 441]|uniref:Uncharacterized protein n=1 Tax=Pisolithus microcarpus 441 TaxID=765257 RepID=A0A0C9ZAJ5_9AGAM|nr:hypothetical protein PISMIDRAFT_271967 [Pisolithus microcarpus 441]